MGRAVDRSLPVCLFRSYDCLLIMMHDTLSSRNQIRVILEEMIHHGVENLLSWAKGGREFCFFFVFFEVRRRSESSQWFGSNV